MLVHRSLAVCQRARAAEPRAPCRQSNIRSQARAVATKSAKDRVLQLLDSGSNLYNVEELAPAVTELLLSCPTPKDQFATQSFIMGQGTWEVFYAPHIARMSAVLGTRFAIEYVLDGMKLFSYVKYESPVFGSGWLSASGTMARKHDDSVEVRFDSFWLDGPDNLRLSVDPGSASALSMDGIIGTLGRASFFPQLAVFPVHWLDPDMCVFEFPPLRSNIAVIRKGSRDL